jgi:hypothetical protein
LWLRLLFVVGRLPFLLEAFDRRQPGIAGFVVCGADRLFRRVAYADAAADLIEKI